MNVYFSVFIDVLTKWPIVRIVKDITAETTIKLCTEMFSDFGVLKIMVMDNG